MHQRLACGGTHCGQRSLRREVCKALAPGVMGPTRRTSTVRGERVRHTGASTRAPVRLPQMAAVRTERQLPSWVEAPCACPGTPLTTICRPRHSHSCDNTVRRCRSRCLPLVVSLLLVMAAKTDGSCPPGTTGSGEHPACNAPPLARFMNRHLESLICMHHDVSAHGEVPTANMCAWKYSIHHNDINQHPSFQTSKYKPLVLGDVCMRTA
jgi:hypothetical protein